jgi:hypothetical protein
VFDNADIIRDGYVPPRESPRFPKACGLCSLPANNYTIEPQSARRISPN